MPLSMDDISSVGDTEEMRKQIRNRRKMRTLKNFKFGLKKVETIVVRTGKEQVERIDERVQQGIVLDTNRYKYIGIAINTEGNLKHQIQEMGQKSNKILIEISAIAEKR